MSAERQMTVIVILRCGHSFVWERTKAEYQSQDERLTENVEWSYALVSGEYGKGETNHVNCQNDIWQVWRTFFPQWNTILIQNKTVMNGKYIKLFFYKRAE